MNYFSRPREDGKWDVLEGTPEEPGRIVTCFDTMEDAAAYIAEQSAIFDELFDRITDIELGDIDTPAEEVVAAAEEATVEDFFEEDEPVKKIIATFDEGEQGVTTVSPGPVFIPSNGSQTWTSTHITVAPLDNNGTVIAHAEPPAPPAEFFTDPNFTKLERYVTITADGRFYTHVAGWGDCHVGYGNQCVSAPKEADYSHFAVGTVLTSDGTTIPTGVIAIKGGHADIGLDAASARSHYDDSSSGTVDVAVGTDEFGIWASGAIRPGTTPEQVQALRASGVSGDWRLIDGELRLIGICSVNVPGFPKLSVAASATELTALIAAGGPPEPHPDLCGCKDSTTDILEELDYLHKIVADAGLEDAALEKLAARILTDDDIDTLYERIIS